MKFNSCINLHTMLDYLWGTNMLQWIKVHQDGPCSVILLYLRAITLLFSVSICTNYYSSISHSTYVFIGLTYQAQDAGNMYSC